ncbi:MAG: FeoA family protein, partial [Oscillospiraceae bacterium]
MCGGYMKSLNDLKPGQKGTVVAIDTMGALKRRLVDMGITPGVVIMIRK